MPDSFLSENQIQSVLDYIATYNSTLTENSNPISEINENKNPAPTPEQISLGQIYFKALKDFPKMERHAILAMMSRMTLLLAEAFLPKTLQRYFQDGKSRG
jgi:uncharacterized protein YneF (UPF0154 family)